MSLADAIVLGGTAAVEKAAKDAGHDVEVPFTGGRGDATAEQTDADSFERDRAEGRRLPQLVCKKKLRREDRGDDARPRQLLGLSVPEMTVLVGGLRVLGANHGGARTATSPSARAS